MTTVEFLIGFWAPLSVVAGVWLASLLIDGDDFPDC